jgi:hypothetical protein
VLALGIDPAEALRRTPDPRLHAPEAAAVGPAYAAFLGALATTYAELTDGRLGGPWPVRVAGLGSGRSSQDAAAARAAVRAALEEGPDRDDAGRAVA